MFSYKKSFLAIFMMALVAARSAIPAGVGREQQYQIVVVDGRMPLESDSSGSTSKQTDSQRDEKLTRDLIKRLLACVGAFGAFCAYGAVRGALVGSDVPLNPFEYLLGYTFLFSLASSLSHD